MKTLKSKMENKENTENNQMDTFGGFFKEMSATFAFPLLTTVVRMTPLLFFNKGYENIPKTLFAYCITGAAIDMAEVFYRVYVKDELRSYGTKQEQILGKPYSCFEKHLFYDLPKKIYNSIKERKIK